MTATNTDKPDDWNTIHRTRGASAAREMFDHGETNPDNVPPRHDDENGPPAPIERAADYPGPEAPTPPKAVVFKTPADWSTGPAKPVDYLVEGWIPRGEVTTLHGDGGTGKTDIACQLLANVARAHPYWLGLPIMAGPVVFISAEESNEMIERRMKRHAKRDGYDLRGLTDLHLWFPDEDDPACALATADKSGLVRPTPLFSGIEAAIAAIAPVLVAVDNCAATYIGSQIDRSGARGYNNQLRRIARGPSKPALLLLDHPSQSGLASGRGGGGNMDWRNAPRSAAWLRDHEDKTRTAEGARVLEHVKSNNGRKAEPIDLHWSDGGFALATGVPTLHLLAKERECDDLFLRLLDERTAQHRNVSDKPSITYAPKVFAGMAGAEGFTSQAFAKSLERLFHSGRIVMQPVGPPSDNRSRIVRAARAMDVGEAAE